MADNIYQNNDFKKWLLEIRNNDKGRFVPYIGDSFGSEDCEKILVIGPRHFCDGIFDIRNLFPLTKKEKLKFIDRKGSVCETDHLCFGCTKITPEDCLANESFDLENQHPNRCPVYVKMGICPLHNKCPFSGRSDAKDSLCNHKRHLRCETLISIHDFLSDKRTHNDRKENEVESKMRGIPYFQSINDFVFRYIIRGDRSKLTPRFSWRKIAFMNLMQRYVSYLETMDNSDALEKKIKSEDIDFCEDVISKLSPDVVICTSNCVKSKMSDVFKRFKYQELPLQAKGDYIVFAKKSSKFINKWESPFMHYAKVRIKSYIVTNGFPKRVDEVTGFFNEIIKDCKDNYSHRGIKMPLIRETILKCFIENYGDEINGSEYHNNTWVLNKTLGIKYQTESLRQFLKYKKNNL